MLIQIQNEKFSVSLIEKFNIFDFYREEKMFEKFTNLFIWEIVTYKKTKILKSFIDFIQRRNEGSIIYTAVPFDFSLVNNENKDGDELNNYSKEQKFCGFRDNVFYLPLKTASENNIYEYCFLCLQSTNQ